MSVDCELYIGYTVNLKEGLTSEDFDFFYDFNQYDRFDCEGEVKLLVDGMNGRYARLIFVDKKIYDIWECKNYYKLQNTIIPDNAYSALNEVYKTMYGEELKKELIEYGLTVHFC